MPLLGPVEFGQLLCDIRSEQQILAFLGALTRSPEVLGRPHVVAALARDYSNVPEYLPAPGRSDLSRQREQLLCPLLRFLEALGRDAELHLVQCDIELVRLVALFAESVLGLRIRGLGASELTKIAVGKS